MDLAMEGFSATQRTRMKKGAFLMSLGDVKSDNKQWPVNDRMRMKGSAVTDASGLVSHVPRQTKVGSNSLDSFYSVMDPEDANTTTTRLLTLLNVSALKSRKRPREDPYPREKLNKRKYLNPIAAGLRPEPDPTELQNEANLQSGDAIDKEIDEFQGDQNDPKCEPRIPHCPFSKKLNLTSKYTIHTTNTLDQVLKS